MDRLLDSAAIGSLYLRRPEIAQIVVDAIRYRDPGHYSLHSFVVMPDHVHMLITPHVPVSELMHFRKGSRRESEIRFWAYRQAFLAGQKLRPLGAEPRGV